MKVNTLLADLPPSTIQSIIDKDNLKKKITYPYQDELKKYAAKELAWCFVAFTFFIESVYYFYNPSDFFYPCQYPNLLSIKDTLHLKTLYEKSIQNGTKMNQMVFNAGFEYFKTHWKECFTQNAINFETKVLVFQIISLSIGTILAIHNFYNFFKYVAKIRCLDLTEGETNAYQKDWKGFTGFTFNLILKSFFLALTYVYLLMGVSHWCTGVPTSVLRMPFFK